MMTKTSQAGKDEAVSNALQTRLDLMIDVVIGGDYWDAFQTPKTYFMKNEKKIENLKKCYKILALDSARVHNILL